MTRARPTAKYWLPLGEPDLACPRLYCFPHAGGGAASFTAWRTIAGVELTVCPVQPPGRAERFHHPAHRSVESYVDALLADAGEQFAGHYALFGHSVGALVAYRLACRLRAEGRPAPVHLFVSGCTPPHRPSPRPLFAGLPTEELVPHLRRLGGTPDIVLDDPGLLELFLPPLRADFALSESYRHRRQEPLAIPVTVFGGADDHRADPAALRAWAELTRGGFATHTYPGGHFYLEHHAAAMLEVISGTMVAC
ncbi:thioesterase II family protein [Actinophytocola oryzae]|uniref:Surfactin synthase thioesterase subunit n=1 Tax=Actinophytocola oryzae TaxID=502181 RepID=A0A4V3FSL4_9PSEU|nr:thioesterase domain-containing protein [Actinophytocola oryzae]TDV47911.1 surfactin synthase thioesterase subunit [Actinophytocola oryzae]